MHSRIFQLSLKPIPSENYIKDTDSIFDEFVGSIADYENASENSWAFRNVSYELLRAFGSIEDDKITWLPKEKLQEVYFKGRYEIFKSEALGLAGASFEAFAGNDRTTQEVLENMLFGLRSAYKDDYDVYIIVSRQEVNENGLLKYGHIYSAPEFESDDYFLMTFDTFMRCIDASHEYYIGAVLDYHF